MPPTVWYGSSFLRELYLEQDGGFVRVEYDKDANKAFLLSDASVYD